jgi:hypothetical protein
MIKFGSEDRNSNGCLWNACKYPFLIAMSSFVQKHYTLDDLSPNFKNLEPYKKRLEIIRLTAQQVIKDFGIHGYEIEFSGAEEKAYQELFEQVKPIIVNLLQKNPEKLSSLLYSIDLNERKVRKILTGGSYNPEDELTDLVLERELQKVVIRKYFAQMENSKNQ